MIKNFFGCGNFVIGVLFLLIIIPVTNDGVSVTVASSALLLFAGMILCTLKICSTLKRNAE